MLLVLKRYVHSFQYCDALLTPSILVLLRSSQSMIKYARHHTTSHTVRNKASAGEEFDNLGLVPHTLGHHTEAQHHGFSAVGILRYDG